jgi:hypothetical protein
MRQTRHGWLLVLVLMLVVAAVPAFRLTTRNAQAGDPGDRDQRTPAVTNPSALPVGARCWVELNPETNGKKERVETSYEGKVARATGEGLMLTVSSVKTRISRPTLSRIPVAGRLFTNVGIAPAKSGEAKNVWIPAEKIRSVMLARNGALSTAPVMVRGIPSP